MRNKFLLLILTITASLLLITGCGNSNTSAEIAESGEIIALEELEFNWENINIEGGLVRHDFEMKNDGDEDLILKGASTSCMCTKAELLLPNGTSSPVFGMHNNPTDWSHAIKPGESFTVRTIFDPMAHGPLATGPVKRTVSLVTSSVPNKHAVKNPQIMGDTVTTITVSGNVLSEEDYHHKLDQDDHHSEEELPEYEIRNTHVFEKIQKGKEFVLIDVRESHELEETGTLDGAIHIPLDSISLDSMESNGISNDDEIIVYCRSGNRSRQAYEVLSDLGFSNVKSMQSGTSHWHESFVPWEVEVKPTELKSDAVNTEKAPQITFDKTEFDFGLIEPDEAKSTTFKVMNKGNEVLEISNITTSCMCTSAAISTKTIKAGEEAVLTVTFDPNVHEEPVEKFKRTVFLETNDPNMPEAEVSVWVDINER